MAQPVAQPLAQTDQVDQVDQIDQMDQMDPIDGAPMRGAREESRGDGGRQPGGGPMHVPERDDESRHGDVWLLLPWYANGTLDPGEHRQVDGHLVECARCREELARCHKLGAALRAAPESAPSPHPIQLARLMARITAAEAAETSPPADRGLAAGQGDRPFGRRRRREDLSGTGETAAIGATSENAAAGPRPPSRRRRPGVGSLLAATPRAVRLALAGQLAALLALALALPLATRLGSGPAPASQQAGAAAQAHPVAPPRAIYMTQSAGADAATAPQPQIRVLFTEAATEKQIRRVLLQVHARLVDGPSAIGTYTLEVPAAPAGGAAAATAPPARAAHPADGPSDSLGIVLGYLRSQPIVRIAEPVAGLPAPAPSAAPAPAAVPPGRSTVR